MARDFGVFTPSKPGDYDPVVPGNIDLHHRPVVRNKDGSISTVRSVSFGTDDGEVLVPTITPDGRNLTPKQALARYRRTGEHLGIFKSPRAATMYAEALHRAQAKEYLPQGAQPRARSPHAPWSDVPPRNMREYEQTMAEHRNPSASAALRGAGLHARRTGLALTQSDVLLRLLASQQQAQPRTGPTLAQVKKHQVGIPRAAMRDVIDRRKPRIRVAEDDPGWLGGWLQRAGRPS